MTNIVRRATAGRDGTHARGVRRGRPRLERLVAWLQPRACASSASPATGVAVDKGAGSGWQPEPFAGARTYVMPNTSGLNAHAKPADFTDTCAPSSPPRDHVIGLRDLARPSSRASPSASWNDSRTTRRLRARASRSRRRSRRPRRRGRRSPGARRRRLRRSRRRAGWLAGRQHVDRRLRERVHGVGADELVDVERGGVRGVLRRRRRPQRALHARARGCRASSSARRSARSRNIWYASLAFATAALPRSGWPSGSRRSVSVSTRLTKNDATDARPWRCRRPRRRAARARRRTRR